VNLFITSARRIMHPFGADVEDLDDPFASVAMLEKLALLNTRPLQGASVPQAPQGDQASTATSGDVGRVFGIQQSTVSDAPAWCDDRRSSRSSALTAGV
jgi:hypothetical protein